MGVIKAAIGDAILTSMWVFSLPLLGLFTRIISTFLGVQTLLPVNLFISINLATILVLLISLIGSALGGASFNPTTTVSLLAAGLKPDASLFSMAVRFPAQAAGGVAGALANMQVMPKEYKHMLKGPYLKVELHEGAIAEGVLTFVLSFALLFIMAKGPKNVLLKIWLLAMATVGLVFAGSNYTGPSMNPANAFGWAFVNDRHNNWQMFYVYWISPLTGATLAGWFFKFLFPAKSNKEKKA